VDLDEKATAPTAFALNVVKFADPLCRRFISMKHRESAYALLRVTFGVIFLFYGVGKFMGGIGNFVLLWFVDLNRYSLDALFGRRNPVGFTA
jgi:hypothetical protein